MNNARLCSALMRIVIATLACQTLHAEKPNPPVQLKLYTDLRFFQWEEFEKNGTRLVNETGLLNSFGFAPRFAIGGDRRFFIEPDISGYVGKVDYDGFLQDTQGNHVPYVSRTGYQGVELLVNGGFAFSLTENVQMTLASGLGFEHWNRDIDDGGKYGYDEKYTAYDFGLGLRFEAWLSGEVSLFLGPTLEIPFSISESIDLASRGQGGPSNLALSPGITPRVSMESGAEAYGFLVSVYVKEWTLSESPQERFIYQPESHRQIWGIRLGYKFGK